MTRVGWLLVLSWVGFIAWTFAGRGAQSSALDQAEALQDSIATLMDTRADDVAALEALSAANRELVAERAADSAAAVEAVNMERLVRAEERAAFEGATRVLQEQLDSAGLVALRQIEASHAEIVRSLEVENQIVRSELEAERELRIAVQLENEHLWARQRADAEVIAGWERVNGLKDAHIQSQNRRKWVERGVAVAGMLCALRCPVPGS